MKACVRHRDAPLTDQPRALIFTAALASMIFVGRAHAHRLGEGPAALADARALAAAGEAREFTGAEVEKITSELRAIGLLMPGPDRT